MYKLLDKENYNGNCEYKLFINKKNILILLHNFF